MRTRMYGGVRGRGLAALSYSIRSTANRSSMLYLEGNHLKEVPL